MGESKSADLKVRFDQPVRLQFQGAKVTYDAGLLAVRELAEAPGLTGLAGRLLVNTCRGRNVQHDLVGLLRQAIYSRLAGYPDTNAADRLASAPAMRLVVTRRASDKQAAARNTVAAFETEILSAEGNREGLVALNAAWASTAMSHTKPRRLILDLDSWESLRHGRQEGAN